jgi:hypothetical protein
MTKTTRAKLTVKVHYLLAVNRYRTAWKHRRHLLSNLGTSGGVIAGLTVISFTLALAYLVTNHVAGFMPNTFLSGLTFLLIAAPALGCIHVFSSGVFYGGDITWRRAAYPLVLMGLSVKNSAVIAKIDGRETAVALIDHRADQHTLCLPNEGGELYQATLPKSSLDSDHFYHMHSSMMSLGGKAEPKEPEKENTYDKKKLYEAFSSSARHSGYAYLKAQTVEFLGLPDEVKANPIAAALILQGQPSEVVSDFINSGVSFDDYTRCIRLGIPVKHVAEASELPEDWAVRMFTAQAEKINA